VAWPPSPLVAVWGTSATQPSPIAAAWLMSIAMLKMSQIQIATPLRIHPLGQLRSTFPRVTCKNTRQLRLGATSGRLSVSHKTWLTASGKLRMKASPQPSPTVREIGMTSTAASWLLRRRASTSSATPTGQQRRLLLSEWKSKQVWAFPNFSKLEHSLKVLIE